MALVCDTKSEPSQPEPIKPKEENEDLEDGEIEDDDEEIPPNPETVPITNPSTPSRTSSVCDSPRTPSERDREKPRDKSKEHRKHEDKGERKKHMTEAEKSILHLRKKEKLEREKWLKFQRERQQQFEPQADDFAKKLEKTLATILKKEKGTSGDDEKSDRKEDEERRGCKRKKRDRHNQKHQKRKTEQPEDYDEEMKDQKPNFGEDFSYNSNSERSYESEYSSEQDGKEDNAQVPPEAKNIPHRREHKKHNKNNKTCMNKQQRGKEHNRNFNNKDNRNKFKETKEMKGVCLAFLQGQCSKGPNECQFSHEAMPQMKLEVCKFYVMDRCMKGESCTYMHEEFPCKFYHSGLQCQNGENCKFAHGVPLSDGLKRLLLKHIETAPEKMMAGFPQVNREELTEMLGLYKDNYPNEPDMPPNNQSNRQPQGQFIDIPSLLDVDVPVPYELQQLGQQQQKDKKDRSARKSRWNDPDPVNNFQQKSDTNNFESFPFNQDLDMRINSNGDIDMRTLPPHPLTSIAQPLQAGYLPNTNYPPPNITGDTDIRNQSFTADIDIRQNRGFEIGGPAPLINQNFNPPADTDIRQLRNDDMTQRPPQDTDIRQFPMDNKIELPPTQRELYARIQAQQKDATFTKDDSNTGDGTDPERSRTPVDNVNWYSDEEEDDDDMPKLTINDPLVEEKKEDEIKQTPAPYDPRADLAKAKTKDTEKISDFSKINITADITKLLSSLTQSATKSPTTDDEKDEDSKSSVLRDPRLDKSERLDPRLSDPRRRRSSAESSKSTHKVSIYEQGPDPESLNLKMDQDDFKLSRPDVDLRTLQLPLVGLRGSAGLENYTPASEIDASFSSHSPIQWHVKEVIIPRPDYAGLRLSVADAEKTGDPRLRKLFRLSVEEKDSPASPEREPGVSTKEGKARADPRLRRAEAEKTDKPKDSLGIQDMNYKQQLNMLQGSAFYQSLTSNQKVMLNQELASHSDQSGHNDPLLNTLLTNLNLIPGGREPMPPIPNQQPGPPMGMGPPPANNVQAALGILQNLGKLNPIANGLLGAAAQHPALLNQMAQSIVQPGLLGAAPGVPNLGQDFPGHFGDPRNQNGLLGNPPFHPPPDQNFDQPPFDDFYPPDMRQGGPPPFMGGPQRNNGGNRDGRNNFNRDRRRGNRNNFGANNRNNQGRNFRHNNRNNNRNNRNSPA